MLKMNYLSFKNLFAEKKIKIFLFILLFWGIPILSHAADKVELKTEYKKGVFESAASIETTAPMEIASEIILDLNTHLRKFEIDSLKWATKGLSGNEKGKDLLWIEYKEGNYNQNTGVFKFLLEIHIGVLSKQVKDVEVEVLLKKETGSNGYPMIIAELYKPCYFLSKAKGVLAIQKKDNKSVFTVKSSIEFGWFFNLFISKSNYNNVAEWRIEVILNNLKTEVEGRSNIYLKKG